MEQPALKRVLSLPQLVLYGLGTTIGAGIYALVGETARVSGYSALASFALAALMAALTALSFAELSSRFPHAAGTAIYVREGFGSARFSALVGLLVIGAGLVSSAALINALVIQLGAYLDLPRIPGVAAFALVLGLIALWGIAESVTIAGLITLVEVGGLVAVIWVSRGALLQSAEQWRPLLEGFMPLHWGAAYAGALLAFYAYVGFEDMVVVAEEVKGVTATLPLGILLTLSITALLYLTITAEALLTFTPDQLGQSASPLVDLYRHYRLKIGQNDSGWVISVVAMFAIINGALIQMIMASRVIYGLARRGQLPAKLAAVNTVTRTPLIATVISTAAVLILAVTGRLASLAELTSLILLIVFAAANLALWRIKGGGPDTSSGFSIPRWVPALGFLVSLSIVAMFFANLWID